VGSGIERSPPACRQGRPERRAIRRPSGIASEANRSTLESKEILLSQVKRAMLLRLLG